MGGVHTDLSGATPLSGLYAAGEVACVSLNGANRLGSNSLTECLVFGARAGRAAAAYADRAGPVGASVAAQASDEERRLNTNFIDATGGTERISAVRAEMHAAMEEAVGIFRTGTKLDAAADTVSRLQQHARRLKLDDRSRTFNTELPSALELGYMLDVAEVVLRSARAADRVAWSASAHRLP